MSPLPTHHRRLSSSGDKETLLGHLIPDPTHSHAPRRTASTAVLVLFAATVLFIAFGGTGGGGTVGSGVEQGVGWINLKSVPWGSAAVNDQRPAGELYQAGADDAVAEQGDYQSGSLGNEEDDTGSKAVEQPVESAGQTVGTFGDDVAMRVNALVSSGALARYVWHKRLPSTQWNQSSASTLVVVGDVHGQHESLSTLLTRITPTSRDAVAPTLLHTGDLVSKAPLNSSLATVAFLRNQSMQGVRGNHDQGVVEWREWMVAYGRLLKSTAASPVADVVEEPSMSKRPKGKGKGMDMKGRPKPKPWSGYGVKGEAIPSVDEVEGYVSSPDEQDRRRKKAASRGLRGPAKLRRSWWSNPPPDLAAELEEDPEASGEGNLEVLSGGEYESEEDGSASVDDDETTSSDEDLEDETAAEPTATGKSTYDYELFDDKSPESDSASSDFTTSTASATVTDGDGDEYDETTTARVHAGPVTTSTTTQGRFHRPKPTSTSNSTAAATLATPSRLDSTTFWSDKDAPHGVDHAILESAGALVGNGWEWLELSESEAKMLGVEIPTGWEWGGDWFEIARHLPLDDYDYLAALPLTLFVEDLASYIVHAGMLPWVDIRDALPPSSTLPSIPSTLKSVSFQSFTPSMTTSSVLLGPARSLLLVPQNTAPFTLLNMRGVRQRGKYLPQKTKNGKAWHAIWNDFWDRCEAEQTTRCTEKVGILYGHWAGQGLTVNPQSIGLDSGCAAGNRLSAFVLSPGTNSSPLSGARSTRSRPTHTLPSTRRHRLAARAWGWGSGETPATNDDDDEPMTDKEVVAEEVEQEADITEADEDEIDEEPVEEVDPDTAFEEEPVEFAGVSAWVVSVKCDGSAE